MSALGVLAGTSIFTSLLGANNAAESATDAGRYNTEVAENDIKLLRVEERQKKGAVRKDGARKTGAIKAAGAASGVAVNAGSVLDTITEQAATNARNEFNISLEADVTASKIRSGAKMGRTAASNKASGYIIGGIGDSLGTAAMAYGSSK